MNPPRVFDGEFYESLNSSQAEVVRGLFGELKEKLGLRTAIDVGCGLGYFSELLAKLGLEVLGVDGRRENVEEAQRRHPGIRFQQCDAQDSALMGLGRFDLVFCFGLLYHLESPFLAIRNLQAMTGRLFLVESVIFPGSEPVMGLVDEAHGDDQGLNYVAFYPTESCLVKMMYKAGFGHVYRFEEMPQHPDFLATAKLRRVRTMLAASGEAIESPRLVTVAEPASPLQPWDARSGLPAPSTMDRFRRFVSRPLPEKVKILKRAAKSRKEDSVL